MKHLNLKAIVLTMAVVIGSAVSLGSSAASIVYHDNYHHDHSHVTVRIHAGPRYVAPYYYASPRTYYYYENTPTYYYNEDNLPAPAYGYHWEAILCTDTYGNPYRCGWKQIPNNE